MGFATIVRGSVLALLGVSTAYADGVCEKGYRDTTAAERQMMMGVMEAAKAALPLAPTGWIIGGYEELSPIGSICMDGETTPWAYNFSRTFNRTDDQAEREQALADAGAELRAAQAARQPRMDALQAKMEAVSAEFAKAAQSGDAERMAASQRAIDAVSKEYEAFFAEAENPQLIESIARTTMQDRTMSIAISVNPGGIYDSDWQSVAPFGGAQSAYRWTTNDDGIETAHALLLYGAWAPREGGGVTSGRRGTTSSAASHAMAVRVEADPGRLDSLLASINFNALAALSR
jgi:hypothetical protein